MKSSEFSALQRAVSSGQRHLFKMYAYNAIPYQINRGISANGYGCLSRLWQNLSQYCLTKPSLTTMSILVYDIT
jgi:hypothetical protein